MLSLVEEEILSEKVTQYPVIYDKGTKGHREKHVVINAWEEIALNLDFIENGEFFLAFYIILLNQSASQGTF